jgi:hypothetical protein
LLVIYQQKDNEIGSKGASALALALKNNNTITTLDLGCEHFFFYLSSSTPREQNWIKRSKCIGIGPLQQQFTFNS